MSGVLLKKNLQHDAILQKYLSSKYTAPEFRALVSGNRALDARCTPNRFSLHNQKRKSLALVSKLMALFARIHASVVSIKVFVVRI